uniref:HrpA n=1 Tax=Pseudomonas syringae pv. tagetis TaxID=129140 RepID=A0A0E3VJA4_9PSED|nr:HrpA [Pseudomonas syringae pv. tagetis]
MVAFSSLTSKLTNLGNGAVNGVGGALQGANTVAANASLQSSILSGTGDSLSVAAQTKASKETDANGAKLITINGPKSHAPGRHGGRGNSILQAEEAQRKQTMDVLNAIEAGKEDSTNKKISATAQNAKGISY